MNPQVTRGGTSFKGAFFYYMHDRDADTRERISWTHTENMITRDPDKAWKVMAYTAKSQDRLKEAAGLPATGRKLQKPVMAYSLSWHPDHDPDRDHMLETARASLAHLDLQEHEALIVAHRDTPHRHVHVMVNRVHPITGKVASSSHSYRKLSDFAYNYQQKHGMDYCPQREENRKKREESKQNRYSDPSIAEAWASSDCGEAFIQALKDKGYTLAQGNKRLVVIDPYGKIHNPLRHLEGVKTKELKARLADADLSSLRDASEASKEIAALHEAKKKEAARKNAPDLKEEFEKSAKPEKRKAPEPEEPEPEQEESRKRNQEKDTISRKKTSGVKNEPDHKPTSDEMRSFKREFADMLASQKREEQRKRYELQTFYNLNAQKKQIEELEHKTEYAPWWRRLFGFTKRDREQLSDLQKSFDDAQTRYREQLQLMRSEFDSARQDLREKYKIDREQERQKRMDGLRKRTSERMRVI